MFHLRQSFSEGGIVSPKAEAFYPIKTTIPANMKKSRFILILSKIFNPRHLFIVLAVILLGLNTINLNKKNTKMKAFREKLPYVFLGFKFSGLKDILGKNSYVGYYTDKDLDDNKAARQFSQAQYILTPIILDLNNLQHEYILFDCSSEQVAWKKIKEINAVPVRKNQFGIILAKNPGFKEKTADKQHKGKK